jgi:predicted phage terminase large subunit-like protein
MDRKGGAWFISTPRGYNYFETLYRRHRDDKAWASFQFPTSANPYIDKAEIEAMRQSLPALVARQEIDAEFVQLAGALFKREHFVQADELPACTRWVRSWDLAFTTKSSSDYSAGAKVGMDANGNVLVADVVRMRAEWPVVLRTIADVARLDGTGVRQGIECVGAQVGALQTLVRDPLLAGIAFQPITVDKDKLTRALPVLTRAEQGKLIIKRAHWTQALIDELCAFDGLGKTHDDQVDALSGAMQMFGTSNYYAVAV